MITYRDDTIDEIIAQAVGALLEHTGHPVSAYHKRDGSSVAGEDAALTVVGYVGEQVQGTLTLVCNEQMIRETLPFPLRELIPGEEDLHDWLGELGNQLLGRIKNKLGVFGVEFRITPPSTIYAENLTLPPAARDSLDWFEFETDCGTLLVRLLVQAPAGWELPLPIIITEPPPTEGDLLLF